MPVTPPLAPDAAPESTRNVYNRIAETIGSGQVPIGYQMMGHVEAFAQDSYMNYKKFVHEGTGKLDAKQRHAIVLASSSAMNCGSCVRHHARECVEKGWTAQQVAEILAVTATCSMYNLNFKFQDLADDAAFEGMPVMLRAHTFQKNSLGEQLVELINIVVSNINGCPKCTANHVKKALQIGLTHEHVNEAIKISATMAAFNVFHRTQ